MRERLAKVLELLGYEPSLPKHHRHNLVNAIALFAAARGDVEVEDACVREQEAIRGPYVPGMDEAAEYPMPGIGILK